MTADYDSNEDVLYVVVGEPRPAEGEDLSGGLVLRYALADNSPCGVTVIGYRRNHWPDKVRQLADIVAGHLQVDIDYVEGVLCTAATAAKACLKS
jgi:hypothetical protein